LTRVADGENGPGTIGPDAKLAEAVSRPPVHVQSPHPRHTPGLLEALDGEQLAGGRNEKARAGAAGAVSRGEGLGLDLLAARGTQSLQLIAPGLEIGNSKVNKLDPDGKTMYLDFSAMSVKSATATLTTKVVNETAAAYVV